MWEIERKLAEDGARPIIFYNRSPTCWQPQVKGLTMMVNSIFNGSRLEDVWLDKASRPSGSAVGSPTDKRNFESAAKGGKRHEAKSSRSRSGRLAIAGDVRRAMRHSPKKQGGILKISHFDSPASMSLLEESNDRGNPADDGGLQ